MKKELNKKSILIVDDSVSIRHNLSDFLVEHGFSITTAANGKEAIEEADKKQYSLVLIDIHMPELDGFELLKILRNRQDYKYTPMLMLTSSTEKDSIIQAKELGATGWITKPFDQEKLNDLLNRYTN